MVQRTLPLGGLRRLIEMLIEGFATLNRRLWILVIPIGLDLCLWLGPRIIPLHLAEALRPAVSSVSQVDPAWRDQLLGLLKDWGEHANLANLLSGYLVPLLLPRLATPGLPGYAPTSWAPAAVWAAIPVPLLALVLGLLLWSLYMVPLADLVRDTGEGGRAMLRRVFQTWWRMVRLGAVALFAILLLLLPAGFLSRVGGLVSPSLATIILFLGVGFFLWVLFYLYFTPSAVLFSAVGPLRAVYYSIRVVRANLWPSVGFILLVSIIRIGTVSLWQRLAVYPLGVLIGLLVNAYVTGGLATAGLIFFRERLRVWLAGRTRPAGIGS